MYVCTVQYTYDCQDQSLYCVYMLQNPDGSMQRAAITQSALSKERRELRAAQREAEMDNVPRDIGKTWIDPVPGGTGTGGTFTIHRAVPVYRSSFHFRFPSPFYTCVHVCVLIMCTRYIC